MKNKVSTPPPTTLIIFNPKFCVGFSLRRFLYSIIISTCIPISLIAQRDVWALGDRIISTANSGCQQSTSTTLQGFVYAPSTFNSQQDENGNLLFFVMSGQVYDANGILHGSISEPITNNTLEGYPELLIVPKPGSCTKYYIIGSQPTSVTNTYTDPIPLYAEYDIMAPNPQAGSLGALIGNISNNVTSVQISNNSSGTWQTPSQHGADMHLAATTLRADGTRILFIQTSGALYASYISNNGISQAQFIASIAVGGSSGIKSELEVFETGSSANKIYRLALPLGSGGNNNYIKLVSLDYQLSVIGNSSLTIGPFLSSSTGDCRLKGVEFSPNGQYLYTVTTEGSYLRCFDAFNGAQVTLNLSQAAFAPFKNSMLEMGKDGSIYYLNSQNGQNPNNLADLGHILNANNPSNASIATVCTFNSHLPFGSLGFPSGIAGNYVTIDILPDQIDQENYLQGNTSLSCCLEKWISDADKYVFQGTAIWTNQNNPLNSSGVVRIKSSFELMPGSTLTLQNMNIEFGLNAKFLVHPGATLNIEGSTLTGNTTCETMWFGIEVWGNPSSSTFGNVTISTFNGVNSKIEQAVVGINTVHDPANLYAWDGGVFTLDQVEFINTKTGISDLSHPFSGIGPNTINNCTFSSTGNGLWYPYQATEGDMFIYANRLTGADLVITGTSNTFNKNNYAIRLNDCQGLNLNQLKFFNCKVGIESQQASGLGLSNHSITSNEFINTHTCLRLINSKQDEISSNIFNLSVGPQDANFYGIYMDNCNGYHIADNLFKHLKYGILAINSGPSFSQIVGQNFGNQFNECWRGIDLRRDNSGVYISCNDFYNVNQPNSEFSQAWTVYGDVENQGSSSKPVGNRFYRSGTRKDLMSSANQNPGCDPTSNFCYYTYDPVSLPSGIPTLLNSNIWLFPTGEQYDASECLGRSLVNESGNDINIAKLMVESETDVILKEIWRNQLLNWILSTNQLDSALANLSNGDLQGIENEFYLQMQARNYTTAEVILNDMTTSGNPEYMDFVAINAIVLNLASNEMLLQQMAAPDYQLILTIAQQEIRHAALARSIINTIDDSLMIPPLESDTGSYRMSADAGTTQNGLILSPNPAHNNLIIQVYDDNASSAELLQLEVINITGKIVVSKTIGLKNGKYNLDTSILSEGVYLLKINNSNYTFNSRFIKIN